MVRGLSLRNRVGVSLLDCAIRSEICNMKQKKRLLHKYDGKKQRWLRLFVGLVILFVAALIVFRFVVGISFVNGDSMLPTLKNGELIAYTRIVPEYERGDIVSVRMPSGEYYVKRVIAVGGDEVNVEDGKILVNGEELDESYVQGTTEVPVDGITVPYTVEEGKVFVLGDNRENSVDSRTFGAVLIKEVQGKLLFVQ